MGHRLDFAPHLGFPTPDRPLFPALAGGPAFSAQIAFAAAQGFSVVQDPFSASRPVAEQQAIGEAAARAGVRLSCFVYAPLARAATPAWSAEDSGGREALSADVDEAIAIGRRLGSLHIAVLCGRDPDRGRAEQRRALAANLASFGDRVAEAGMTLSIEAVDANRLPQMLLHRTADALEVVRDAAHPAVRLIFDTAHVRAMDGDVLAAMDRAWDHIELIQLADYPGRVEPGQGELDFEQILDEIQARGFAGPVELEHMWAVGGIEAERRYLSWLGRWRGGASVY